MNDRTHNKAALIASAAIALLFFAAAAAGIYFFQFTAIGYRMSVPFRPSFEKIGENVYINKLDQEEKDSELGTIKDMIAEAKERVGECFGELSGSDKTVIILCDDKGMLESLGGDHDTKTVFFPTQKSYISLSPDYFTVDVLAHELTHAELHSRLSLDAIKKLPTWFDEGLAMQNDNRRSYGDEAWAELTDNGANTVAPSDMDTPEEFYAGTEDDIRLRYVCAKREVADWLSERGRQGVDDLIDKLNSGEDFYTAYGE